MRRRHVLVPLGTLALLVAGIAGADIVGESRQRAAEAGAASAQAAAASLPADFGKSIPQKSGVTVPRQQAASALCQAVPESVRGLTRIAENVPALENLRDGIPELDRRLAEVELAAEGRPALGPVVTRMTMVRDLWRSALEAADEGKTAKAEADLQEAELEIRGLGADLEKAYPGHGKDCSTATKKSG